MQRRTEGADTSYIK